MRPDSANMRQQATNYNAMRCSNMAKAYNPIELSLYVIRRMMNAGMSQSFSLKATEAALFALNALEYGDTEGIEITRLAKKLYVKVPSTALRIFRTIADEPDKVRGKGFVLGWFSIRENFQDGRYMNLIMNERGAIIKQQLLNTNTAAGEITQINADIDEIKAMSVTHHHLEVETGKFSWFNIESEAWGQSQDKPIPVQTGYRPLQPHDRALVEAKEYWWVDEKTGHTWKGDPRSFVAQPANPYVRGSARRNRVAGTGKRLKMQRSLGYTEAMRLEKRGMTRVRNPKGMWEIYEPDVAIDMEPPYGTVLPTTESEMDALCKQSFRDFKSKVPLEDILSERDYILNKTDFNKFRQRFTNFLDNERVKADEKADSLKRGANEADRMSRQAADDANDTMERAYGVPVHMLNDREAIISTAKNQANQLSKDSALYDQAAYENRTYVEKLEKQMMEMQKAIAELKGKE